MLRPRLRPLPRLRLPGPSMPLKSKAQRRYLWATDPKLAKKFEKETPKGKKLPEHAKKKKK